MAKLSLKGFCEFCNKEIDISPTGRDKRFCNRTCNKRFYQKRTKECKSCGIEFTDITLSNGKQYCRKLCRELFDMYGIGVSTYNKLCKKADYRCQICDKSLETRYDTAVDHCHETGRIRGILCRNCNFILGHSKDSIGTLEKAATYLKNLTKDY